MPGKALAVGGFVRWRIAVSVAIGLAVTACYGLQGGLLALLLEHAVGGAPDPQVMAPHVMPLLLALVAVLLARALLLWGAEIAAQATARTVKETLRGRLLRHLFDLGPGVTLRRRTGELQAILVGGVEALETYHSRYLPAVWNAVLGCCGILAAIAAVDWPSAALLCLFVGGFPVLDRLWLRWRMPRTSGLFAALGALGAYLLDSLQGIVTVKAFGASARRRAVLADHAAALRRESMTTLAVTLMRTGLTGLVMLSGMALVLSAGAWRVSSGTLDPFAMLVTLFLAREAFRPLERLEREFHSAWAVGGAVAPIMEFLAMEPPMREADRPLPAPPTHDIRFEDVRFSYAGGGAPSLDAVSFHVGAREHVALVGPSGAGKSTVVVLLLRLFDPDAGTIRIGGTDIRSLPLETLRSLISVVSQDTVLFEGTVADNLKLAKPDATDEEIRAAAQAAHIDGLIESLPLGYATPIGERGATLSGGQRQRIAIARALLKNAPILILDEATSSVDPASEQAIREALARSSGRRTTLVIAHRLSAVADADRILVFDGGRLVEDGARPDLERSGGVYARLAALQGEAA